MFKCVVHFFNGLKSTQYNNIMNTVSKKMCFNMNENKRTKKLIAFNKSVNNVLKHFKNNLKILNRNLKSKTNTIKCKIETIFSNSSLIKLCTVFEELYTV